MTITREQVEAMRLRCTSEMVEYRLADQLDDMLRDLWQRVEQAESRLDYVLSVMRSHGYWAALMTDEEVLAQVDAERGAK